MRLIHSDLYELRTQTLSDSESDAFLLGVSGMFMRSLQRCQPGHQASFFEALNNLSESGYEKHYSRQTKRELLSSDAIQARAITAIIQNGGGLASGLMQAFSDDDTLLQVLENWKLIAGLISD